MFSPAKFTKLRELSISESEIPSFVNLKNLGYNILKILNDETVEDIEFPELDLCSECGNDILITLSTYPASSCRKNMDILDQANAFGIVSNLPIPDFRVTSQSSEISPLSNLIGMFTLSSLIRMEGIENTATQQVKSVLRCAKYSENLSSSLPLLGFLRISLQLQGLLKALVYLICKYIVHYNCINNPRKLCPICPLTDMKIDDLETPTEQSSSTVQKNVLASLLLKRI
ncbi:hypothetical protein C1646_773560 [Rhizophagus diaphanus]|nr:hypothetical protein C1646_773560 [Rhizophagus diaphanus] [Rhizophagus sp. MUCL 43196]